MKRKLTEYSDVEKYFLHKMNLFNRDCLINKSFYDYSRRQYSKLRARARNTFYNLHPKVIEPLIIIHAIKNLSCSMNWFLIKLEKQEREHVYNMLMDNFKEFIFQLIEKNENDMEK